MRGLYEPILSTMIRMLMAIGLLASCVQGGVVVCGDGRGCPEGKVCDLTHGLLHYDGTWTVMTSPTTQYLNGVWGRAANDVYAVGEGGAIFHYDGRVWEPLETGTPNSLYAIGGSATQVYAVGVRTVVRHAGASWTSIGVATGSVVDVTLGSAPGEELVLGQAALYQRRTQGLVAISGVPATSEGYAGVWASGSEMFVGDADGNVHHYNGASWSTQAVENYEIMHALWGSDPDNVYAASKDARLVHYNGAGWSSETTRMSVVDTRPVVIEPRRLLAFRS